MSKYFFLPDGIICPTVIYTEGMGDHTIVVFENSEKTFKYKLQKEYSSKLVISNIKSQMEDHFSDDVINLIGVLTTYAQLDKNEVITEQEGQLPPTVVKPTQ